MSELKTDFMTSWVIALAALLLAGYDLYAFRKEGHGHTISEVLTTWSLRHPLVPFALGVLMGHFFWPQVLIECSRLAEVCR